MALLRDAAAALVPRRARALPFLMLAYPTFWLLAGRTCPTPSGALEPCRLGSPLRFTVTLVASLAGCYVAVAAGTAAARRAGLSLPLPARLRRTLRPTPRTLAGAGAVTLGWWTYVLVGDAAAVPGVVETALTLLGAAVLFPAVAVWVALVAAGNVAGEPAFAVQQAVVAVGFALDAAWVWWLVSAADRALTRRASG